MSEVHTKAAICLLFLRLFGAKDEWMDASCDDEWRRFGGDVVWIW
jgi:hypothetical protein